MQNEEEIPMQEPNVNDRVELKLYDRIDEEVEEEEAKSNICILVTVFLFLIVFAGLTILNYQTSTSHLLELQAEDLMNKIDVYERDMDRIKTQITQQVQEYIPAIKKRRHISGCQLFSAKINETDSKKAVADGNIYLNVTKPLDFPNIKNNLTYINEVHLGYVKNFKYTTFPQLYNNKIKAVDLKVTTQRNAQNNAVWEFTVLLQNVREATFEYCYLVSGDETTGK